MSDKVFNIVFKGEILPGADEAAVKTNVGKLFKANEQVLARLFSGETIAIKKNVDKAGAMKYRALMKKAGAVCYAIEPGADLSSIAKPNPRPTPAPAQSRPVADDQPTVEEEQEDSGWSLAPVGVTLVEPTVIEGVELPDVEGITLAELGVDLIETRKTPEPEPIPDISGIELAPVGSDVADPSEKASVPIPDTSAIDLAPPGSDVADPVEHHHPEPPDVSQIDLASPGSDVADASPEVPEPKIDISHITLE